MKASHGALVPEPGLSIFASIVGLHAVHVEAVLRHAERELSRGDFNSALESYRAATLLRPGDASGWMGIAHCYGKLGEAHRAAAALRVAAVFTKENLT